jgi:hypothetical protein
VLMDWEKVKELRAKVLAEEEELVEEAIRVDNARRRIGPSVHRASKKSGPVRDIKDEQTRAVLEWFGWDPNKAAKPLKKGRGA